MTNEHAQGLGMKEEEAGHQICILSEEEKKEGGMGMQHVDSAQLVFGFYMMLRNLMIIRF